jgi:hypothetical protein
MTLNWIGVINTTLTSISLVNRNAMITQKKLSTSWTRYETIPISGIWIVDIFGSCFWMGLSNVLSKARIARTFHVANSAQEWASPVSSLRHILKYIANN